MKIGNWITNRLCPAVAVLSLFVSVNATQAQVQTQPQPSPKAQITAPINPEQRKVLGNSVHPVAASARDLGRADASLPMKDMLLLLQPTQAQSDALKKLVDDLHNPNSTNFHKWITPAVYATQYGIGDADIKTVSDWLSSSGFTVEQVAHGKNWIRFSGTSSQVETAFRTTIHAYSVQGETKYANATSLSIPAALAPAVAGVVRLNNFLSKAEHVAPGKITRNQSGKLVRVNATGTAQQTLPAGKQPTPGITINGDQTETYLTPADFAKIYDSQSVLSSGVDGTGVSIAIVGRSDIELSDVEAFRTIFGMPFNDPTVIYPTTDPGDVSGDDVEGSLDVEWAGAVAPKAQINFVAGASTAVTDGVDVAASYIVDSALSPIMTVSFGLCEAEMSDTQVAFYHLLWQQAASEGISVFVSTGDSGASGCNDPDNIATVYGFGVSGLASTPYNTAVGGTEFNDPDLSTYWNLTNASDQSSVKGYIPEAIWNESCTSGIPFGLTNCNYPPYSVQSYAGNGGASSCVTRTFDDSGDEYCAAGYPKPSWQTGTGVPTDGARDLPDVSLAAAAAHDGFTFCFEGGCQWTTNSDGTFTIQNANVIGGTSAASPSMAGIMALVEQKHGAFQGVANYQLYNLASQQNGSCDSSSRTDPTKASACVFNDVTLGSNAIACYIGNQDCQGVDQPVQVGITYGSPIFDPSSQMDGYSATTGYDLSSGLGSVDIANLVAAWGTLTTAPSATTLSLSKTTFAHGTPITVSGTVDPSSGTGTPTGEVLLSTSNNTSVLTTPLATGAYTASSTDMPGGTYTVTAKYSGDTTYSASSSQPVSVTVAPEASTLTGTTYAPSRFYILGRQPIIETSATMLSNTFWVQFQVSGLSGSTAATGSIKLSVAGKTIGTYPVSSTGLIYVTCGPLTPCDYPVGTYTFQADYSGDSSFNASTGTVQFTITQGRAYWNSSVNNQTPVANTPVIGYVYFRTDPNIPPTGTVTLTRDDTGAVLGTGTIDNTGLATIPFSPDPGDFNLVATWAGDSNYIAAGQADTEEVVTQSNTGTKKMSLTLNLGGTSFSLGQRSQITVSAASATTGSTTPPIGFVTLYNGNGQVGGQLALSAGKATGLVEWDVVGPQSVYAVYGGDGNYSTGSSSPTPINVAQGLPSLAVQPLAGYVVTGGQTSITALISSPVVSSTIPLPTGSIQFYDSVGGAPVQPIGTPQGITGGNQGVLLATVAALLPQGSNVITAVYSGDTNWQSVTSSATAPILVTTPTFTDTATPNPLIVTAGETASISVSTQSILGFSAPIALSCGGTLPEGISCAPATVTPGSTGTVTLTSTAPGVSTETASASSSSLLKAAGEIAFAGLLLLFIPNRRRFHHLSIALLVLGSLGIVSGLAGCGSSGVKSTTMVLSSSNTKVASGASVDLVATIASRDNLTGTVTFYDNGTALGSAVSVSNGAATLTTSTLPVGTHAITAKYSGDKDDSGSSSSNMIEQTVTGSFSLTINATSGTLSQPLTIPATLN